MKFLFSALLAVLLFGYTNPVCAMKSNHGLDGFVEGKIDASKNARLHSNMGNIYFDEKKYPSALKEYEIAFNLGYKSQAAGAYLYNISRCYYAMGNYNLAREAVLGAIKKDCINMTYYEMLADCIVKLNLTKSELKKYISDTKNPYNRIVVGLIYLKTGNKMQARATFDDFISLYPDMIIADDVKRLLSKI